MRLGILLISIGLSLASWTTSGAVVSKSPSKKSSSTKGHSKARKKSSASHLQTDVSFDDSVLHGQYQSPEEALAKVENEKGLGDLVGVRKHFKDRLTEAAEQE